MKWRAAITDDFASVILPALSALAGLGGAVWLILGVGYDWASLQPVWSWHLLWLLLLLPWGLWGVLCTGMWVDSIWPGDPNQENYLG